MPECYLLCEGETDKQILDSILRQREGLFLQIEFTGGGPKPRLIRGFLDGQGSPPKDAFSIEDRDYEPLQKSVDRWNDPVEKSLIWNRHEIENFLLEPYVLQGVFDEYRSTVSAAWVNGLPSTIADCTILLHSAARKLFTHHIANLVCAELKDLFQRATTGFQRPGGDPFVKTPVEWQDDIFKETQRFQSECQTAITEPKFSQSYIQQSWGNWETIVTDPSFLDSNQFLIDMAGKQLLHAVFRETQPMTGGKLQIKRFAKDLCDSFARNFQPGTCIPPDEMTELANRLRPFAK